MVRLALLATTLSAGLPGGAAGQSRLFPAEPRFELPLGSPRSNDLTGRLMYVGTSDDRFGPGWEAEVSLGEDFPLIALRRGPKPIALGFGGMVYGRYRLDDPLSSQISNDWMAGINVTGDLHPWDFTLQLYHESSHLGDEYAETFQASRLDWTREVAAAWAGYSLGPWRAVLGLDYVLVTRPDLPRTGASLGVDYRGKKFGFLGTSGRLLGGVFAEAWAATNWRVSPTVKLGVGFRGDQSGHRELRFSLIVHSGLSTQRQFYQNASTFYGAEFQFDL